MLSPKNTVGTTHTRNLACDPCATQKVLIKKPKVVTECQLCRKHFAGYYEKILNAYFLFSWSSWSIWSEMCIKYTNHQRVDIEKKSLWRKKSLLSLKVKGVIREDVIERGKESVRSENTAGGGQDWGREKLIWQAQSLWRGAAGNNAENSIRY